MRNRRTGGCVISAAARPDPNEIFTREEFAQALTALRESAGFTVRETAVELGIPPATLGGYLSGRHLPPARQQSILVGFLRLCGTRDPDEVRAWLEALTRVRRVSDGRVQRAAAPYRGLEPFQPADAPLFFGRDDVIQTLLTHLADDDGPAARGPLFVVGASGIGKSSVLRAGLVAAVRNGLLNRGRQHWAAMLTTPGTDPANRLTEALDGALEDRVVVVIDQFEEIFTSNDETARAALVAQLSRVHYSRHRVVLGLRADFYGQVAEIPFLVRALNTSQVVVGPLTPEQLREVIVRPAEAAGAVVAEDLVHLLVAGLGRGTPSPDGQEPGVLPLLSHALLATWQRANRRQLTVTDFFASGGVRAAIQQSAEELYAELSPSGQELTRRVFLRLANLHDPHGLTRRHVDRAELADLADDLPDVDADELINRFVEARLITVSAETMSVSHEALLRAWPRLNSWMDADRVSLLVHRRITEAANAWDESGRDDGLLLRGGPLVGAREWDEDARNRASLNRSERELIDTSIWRAEAEENVRRRHTRALQQLLVAIAVLAVVAAGLGAYGLHARNEANARRHEANSVRDEALSREVANEVGQVRDEDPSLAAQLALGAYRISPTIEARSALIDTSARPAVRRLLGPSGPTAFALSADGHLLAVARADTGAVTLYQLGGGAPVILARLPAARAQLFAMAFNPASDRLATGSAKGVVTLWNVSHPARPTRVADGLARFSESVQGLAFSPDGRTLAAAGADPALREWDVSNATGPHELATPVGIPVATPAAPYVGQAVAFSPDGAWLVLAGSNGSALAWRRGRAAPATLRLSDGRALAAVRFSPDGSLLALGSQSSDVGIWTMAGSPATNPDRTLTGFTSWAAALAFSPDGSTLYAGGSDKTIRTWDTSTWAPGPVRHVPGPATVVALTPDGTTLLTSSADGSVRLWPVRAPGAAGLDGSVFAVAYNRDATLLAAAASGEHGDVSLWRPAAHSLTPVGKVVPGAEFGPVDGTAALTPDGRMLAVGNKAGQVELWNVADPARPVRLSAPMAHDKYLIESLAFRPDGRTLAVGSDDGGVTLWDVSDPERPRRDAFLDTGGVAGQVLGVAFNPSGTMLAAASTNDKVYLWHVTRTANTLRATPAGRLGGFRNYAWAVTFSPDGTLLAAASADHSTLLWDVSRQRPTRVGPRLSGPTDYATGVSFSHDGRQLAIDSNDGSLWLWDVRHPATPTHEATLRASTGGLATGSFTPGGSTLVAAGADRELYHWDTDLARDAAAVCASSGAAITRAEWNQYVPGAAYDPPCH
jgi:WD40 repeat protein